VRQGQAAQVTVDSFPGRVFTGKVTFIAQEAQFTPRNVQTKDERATTVFAVRVELANPDHALKPGMPADAVIVE
jgi:membrane fusion protein YbhG